MRQSTRRARQHLPRARARLLLLSPPDWDATRERAPLLIPIIRNARARPYSLRESGTRAPLLSPRIESAHRELVLSLCVFKLVNENGSWVSVSLCVSASALLLARFSALRYPESQRPEDCRREGHRIRGQGEKTKQNNTGNRFRVYWTIPPVHAFSVSAKQLIVLLSYTSWCLVTFTVWFPLMHVP